MPVYQLDEHIRFPHPELAETDGLLAVGGDLSPERLILAYANGIFPWYNPGDPILWWSLDPRAVLFPKDFKLTKSLKQSIRKYNYQFKINAEFPALIRACANIPRNGQEGTWISEEMERAYIRLSELGYAFSIETYSENQLVGGLYGVQIDDVFSGESMFHTKCDASKAALYFLCKMAESLNIRMIDVQQPTEHMKSMGAFDMDRAEFLRNLRALRQ
ncbi:MAG: leucyl/phenylalanyl-tRNA--protein transferase [Bacteroidales bacterium]|jgi:leucyl/phenylalanyl-tRNA--protein transferase|nr:leucyl/phenylalanyl-tRNA--protein transferase [Bacteroidales bacterium]